MLNILASLCSWGDWFESQFVRNPQDRFCCVEALSIIEMFSGMIKHYDWELLFLVAYKWAKTCAFQQCGILTIADSEESAQPRFKLRTPNDFLSVA